MIDEHTCAGYGNMEVKFTMDRMRYAINGMLSEHLVAASGDVERAFDRALANFDLDREIERIVFQEMQRELERTIKNAISSATYDADFQRELRKMMLQRMLDGVQRKEAYLREASEVLG